MGGGGRGTGREARSREGLEHGQTTPNVSGPWEQWGHCCTGSAVWDRGAVAGKVATTILFIHQWRNLSCP